MEALPGVPRSVSRPEINLEKIKEKLVKQGVQPTPRILHNLRMKEIQKFNRRQAKEAEKLPPPPSAAQQQEIKEESDFQLIKSEYKRFRNSIRNRERVRLVGEPWERLEKLRLKELASESMGHDGPGLNTKHLKDLGDIIERDTEKFSWILDNDIELSEEWHEEDDKKWAPKQRSETEAIKLLIDRLSGTEMSSKDWKFTRIMRFSGLQFTEKQMLRILEGLRNKGQWKNALSVVEWVYSSKEHRHSRSRFVYTKLLSVFGRCRKPREALQLFNMMRRDPHIYPDMAAYHSLAVTLGQAGLVKELISIVNSLKEGSMIGNTKRRRNPVLEPDIVIFNAVLNACVSTCQWKGVSWVFQQLRKNSLRPNGATFGLAMEVMLKSGKYDLVHEYFEKMKRTGEVKALTYKAFWEEAKVDEAVEAVRDMERRGIVGAASVYYELARCLCFHGRWQEAILEINRLESIHPRKPLAVTFTGLVMSALDGGHFRDCIALYDYSKKRIAPNTGLINAMLKVYGKNDMFLEAKALFEETIRGDSSSQTTEETDDSSPKADAYTFRSMLETSATALQWEYFEYVYKEMILAGYGIDPRKQCSLLVKASIVGKLHLLEHTFEAMLEDGQIPPAPFFTEMACQAISKLNYERAMNIISTMGFAPFQVSFREWLDFFERNRDRIPETCLIELRSKLIDHHIASEATPLNFSKALDFFLDSYGNATPNSASLVASTLEVSYSAKTNFGSRTGAPDYDSVTEVSEFDAGDQHEELFDSESTALATKIEGFESDEPGALSAYEILEIWNTS